VKLLLDENLSDRIIPRILDLYPGSAHVKSQSLIHTDDRLIWAFALEHAFTLVSKDADFHQRSLVLGQPPKLLFLPVGNCATNQIIDLLRSNFDHISAFGADPNTSIMILPAPQTPNRLEGAS
jgi:predicted nuclease of predicted toxin-antitoxin system